MHHFPWYALLIFFSCYSQLYTKQAVRMVKVPTDYNFRTEWQQRLLGISIMTSQMKYILNFCPVHKPHVL